MTAVQPDAGYTPYGSAWTLLHSQAPQILVSGPAGTGKSRACLTKLHLCAEHKPGFRGLILRKTRESLTESGLVTFEQIVLPAGHPALAGSQRRLRQAYRYPNGSEVIAGGLNKPEKIMSSEYDMIYIQECIELTEDDFERATTRLRGRALPFSQLIADSNPDRPMHWLRLRCNSGKTLLLESRHEENPLLWDMKARRWTPFGESYIAKLDALTGPRKQRLRYGRWVQAEGVVYEGWDAAVHVIDRFPVPDSWPRYLTIDFGFVNPFVASWYAQDEGGRLYRYREIYRTKRLVEDHARDIAAAMRGEPRPRRIICDHDAEDRATLERYLGLPTAPAIKDVSSGIQQVAARLRPAADGRPRLFFLRDSLVQRDPELWESKKPMDTIEEFDGYVWDVGGVRREGELPVKENDHGLDALRYLCRWLFTPTGLFGDTSASLSDDEPVFVPRMRE
jgi:PBSX family phage terminase large subunit